MSAVAIRVEGLGKRYRIGRRERYYTLRDTLMNALKAPFGLFHADGKQGSAVQDRDDTIWALKDISFEVKRGEVVGIIGRNGAGKSTLLKILSRITEPTEGYAEINGRVGSLLEVGTGFHPELTGRENIYLNGAILGMKKREMNRKFDEIVDFAEVEKFIDTPVKHYSSGMHMRLGFSVAAHLEAEILLVDEVLAMGDFAFQSKCLGRMRSIGREGRTLLFVTHNMGIVPQLCQRTIFFQEGKIIEEGDPWSVIRRYLNQGRSASSEWMRPSGPSPERGITITRLRVHDQEGNPAEEFRSDEPFCAEITYAVRGSKVSSRIVLEVETEHGLLLFATTDCDRGAGVDQTREPGTYTSYCVFPAHLLAPGTYFLTPAASWTNRIEWDRVPRPLTFRVSHVGSLCLIDRRPGFFAPILSWETKQTAHDLPHSAPLEDS